MGKDFDMAFMKREIEELATKLMLTKLELDKAVKLLARYERIIKFKDEAFEVPENVEVN